MRSPHTCVGGRCHSFQETIKVSTVFFLKLSSPKMFLLPRSCARSVDPDMDGFRYDPRHGGCLPTSCPATTTSAATSASTSAIAHTLVRSVERTPPFLDVHDRRNGRKQGGEQQEVEQEEGEKRRQ